MRGGAFAFAYALATYSSKHFRMTLANFGRGEGAEEIVGQLADVMLIEVDLRAKSSFEAAARRLMGEVYDVQQARLDGKST